jgi:hypothetical protein
MSARWVPGFSGSSSKSQTVSSRNTSLRKLWNVKDKEYHKMKRKIKKEPL